MTTLGRSIGGSGEHIRIGSESRAIFARFRRLPGSEQVATDYAIEGLLRWLRRRRPRHVYEAGGGIGCLSAIILAVCPISDRRFGYQMEERNAFCRSAWDEHLGRTAGTAVFKTIDWTPPSRPFDFVVVDGPHGPYWEHLASRATVFFEGNRIPERAALAAALRRGHRRVAWANWRPLDRSKGVWIAQLDPAVVESCWFGLVRFWQRALDLVVCRTTGRRPGWRRRDTELGA